MFSALSVVPSLNSKTVDFVSQGSVVHFSGEVVKLQTLCVQFTHDFVYKISKSVDTVTSQRCNCCNKQVIC